MPEVWLTREYTAPPEGTPPPPSAYTSRSYISRASASASEVVNAMGGRRLAETVAGGAVNAVTVGGRSTVNAVATDHAPVTPLALARHRHVRAPEGRSTVGV